MQTCSHNRMIDTFKQLTESTTKRRRSCNPSRHSLLRFCLAVSARLSLACACGGSWRLVSCIIPTPSLKCRTFPVTKVPHSRRADPSVCWLKQYKISRFCARLFARSSIVYLCYLVLVVVVVARARRNRTRCASASRENESRTRRAYWWRVLSYVANRGSSRV